MEPEDDDDAEAPGARVFVTVGRMTFAVPIGSGTQDVRWLGLVAAQRYALALKAKGRQRQRENNLTDPGYFIPSEVLLRGSSDAIHPRTKLCDVCRDGDEVSVTLQQEVEVGSNGEPVINGWGAQAFLHSEEGLRRAAAAVSRAEEATREGKSDSESKLDEIFGGDVPPEEEFDTPEQVAAALEFDWSHMELSFAEGCDVNEMKNHMLASFVNITELFSYYGRHRGTTPTTLGFMDCLHCLHHCKVLTLSDVDSADYALLEAVVMEATRTPGDASPTSCIIYRHHFIEIILRALASKHKAVMVPSELKLLLSRPLGARSAALRSDPLRRALSGKWEDATDVILEEHGRLTAVFQRYSLGNSSPGTISLQEFFLAIQDAGILTGDDQPTIFRKAQSAFKQAQRENPAGSDDDAVLEHCVFCEFVEGAARVAMASNKELKPNTAVAEVVAALSALSPSF